MRTIATISSRNLSVRIFRAAFALGAVLLPLQALAAELLVQREHPNPVILNFGSATGLTEGQDGNLYIFGQGLRYLDGHWSEQVFRLDAQGEIDRTWQLRQASLDKVTAVAATPSGDVFLATSHASGARLHKYRTDGSRIENWQVDVNFDITHLEFDAMDRLVMAGGFDAPYDRLAIIDMQTGIALPPGFQLPPGGLISMNRVPDGRLYIATFDISTSTTTLVRVGTDGSIDPSWSVTMPTLIGPVAAAPGGDLYVSTITHETGTPTVRLVKLRGEDGTIEPLWTPTATFNDDWPRITSMAVASDGSLFVAGDFTEIVGMPRPGIAKLQGHGSGANDPVWQAPGWLETWEWVYAMTEHGGALQIVGQFVGQGSDPEPASAARLDLSSGDLLAAQRLGTPGRIDYMVRQSNGGTVISGQFSLVDGHRVPHIARLDENWQVDTAWQLDLTGIIYAIVEDASGRLLVAGNFQVTEQPDLLNLIRVSGRGPAAIDMNWLPMPDGAVHELAVDDDGTVYLSGYMQTLFGQPVGSLVRLDPDSNLPDLFWTPSISGSGLFLDGSGFLYVSHSIGLQKRIVRLPTSGSGEPDPQWSSVPNSTGGGKLAIDAEGNLVVAGNYPLTFITQSSHLLAYPTAPDPHKAIAPIWQRQPGGTANDLVISPSNLAYFVFSRGLGTGSMSPVLRILPDGQTDTTLGTLFSGSAKVVELEGNTMLFAGTPGWTARGFRTGLAVFDLRDDPIFAGDFDS